MPINVNKNIMLLCIQKTLFQWAEGVRRTTFITALTQFEILGRYQDLRSKGSFTTTIANAYIQF